MSTQREAAISTQDKTKELVTDALFIALTFAATMFINIRLPLMGNGGLIHLGNVPMFLGAFVFGKRTGALAGGIGMGLFDLISGWTAWAPFTLISEKLKVRPIIANTVAVIAALIIKIAGYYLAEGILFGNWVAPLGSIPGNIIQVASEGVIVIPFAGKLKQIAARY